MKVTSTALSSSVEGTYPVTFEVVNSLGDAASLTLDVEIHARTADEPRITLSQYIVYLNEGETFSPLQYLSDVSGRQRRGGARVTPGRRIAAGAQQGQLRLLERQRDRDGDIICGSGVNRQMEEQRELRWTELNPACLLRRVLRELPVILAAALRRYC